MNKPVVLKFGDTMLVDIRTVDPYVRTMLPELAHEYKDNWVILDPEDAIELNLTPSSIFGEGPDEGEA